MKKAIRCPKHLSPEARIIWKEILSEYDIQDSAGLRILRISLESFDRSQECRKKIDEDGLIFYDKFNQKKSHPLLAIERDSRAAFLAGLKALNLDLEPLRDVPGRPRGDDMGTNRKRLTRASKNRIPLNLTEEYFRDLVMRDFLADGCGSMSTYDDAPTDEEKVLLKEFKKCKCNFEKWLKFKRG